MQSLAPETLRSLGAVDGVPLVYVFNRPQATLRSSGLGVFARLGLADFGLPGVVLADSVADSAAAVGASPPQPAPTRTASPAPAPVPTAVAAAAARLIVGEFPDPIGDGDWRAARAAIGAFYAARGFEPVWVDRYGLTRAGRAALAQIERAADDGLSLSGVAPPREVAAGLGPDDLARAELAITAAVVAYAEQASGSRIAPSRISPLIGAAPSVADPGEALAETAAAADPGARLAAFNPPQKGYRELREELKRLADSAPGAVRRAALDLGADLTGTPLVASDASFGADPQLGSLPAKKGSRRSRAYTASADPMLRGSASRRRASILANMEMWRWEPREMGARRIEVNIPDFSVTVFEGDTAVHSARVVVGKPQTPTPVFSNVMRYVLINPEWQVPESIVKKEILPRTRPLPAPRVPGEDDRRAGHRAPAAGRGQRARAARLHVPERALGLPARYAGPRTVLGGHTRPEPRLRASRRSHAPRRARARMAGEPHQRRDRRTGANGLSAAAAAGPHRIFHRFRGRGRNPAGEAGCIRPDAKGRSTHCLRRVKIKSGWLWVYTPSPSICPFLWR